MVDAGYLTTLYENGDGPAMGVMIDGHYDKQEFADVVNSECGHKPGDKKFATADKVECVWYRVTPQKLIAWDNRPGRGAKAVTVFEW